MVLRTGSISWKCLWKNVRRKYKFTKTSLFPSSNQQKRNAIKLPLSYRSVKAKSRISGSSTRGLFKRTNLQPERLMPQASTPKSIMLLKQPKRRRNCNAMVMSLMQKTKNVRKKSKQWQQPCYTWRIGTRITVTSSCKALRVLTLNASRSLRTSAVQSVKTCLRNVVICSKCRRTSMLHRESWWM